jgi:outer membrane protein assembly factor BamB
MTRRVLRSMGAVALSVSLAGCWLQPGAGPHRDGSNPLEDDLTAAEAPDLGQAWSVDLGDLPVNDPTISPAGVHATTDDLVTTLRRADGSTRWSQAVPELISWVEAATFHRDRLLVPMGATTGGGTRVFDAATGRQFDTTANTNSAATIGDGVLAGEFIGRAGVDFFTFFEIYDLDEPSRSWSNFRPTDTFSRDGVTIGAGRLFNGSAAFPLQPHDGCLRQSGVVSCPPLWSVPTSGVVNAVLSPDETSLFLAERNGTVTAVDPEDGAVQWRSDLGGRRRREIHTTPTVGGGNVYVPTSDGTVFTLPVDGCRRATCTAAVLGVAGHPVTEQAALAGGVLYVAADDGAVTALPAAGCGRPPCSPLWEAETGSRITGAPAVAFGHLVIGTEDGRVIAYRAGS